MDIEVPVPDSLQGKTMPDSQPKSYIGGEIQEIQMTLDNLFKGQVGFREDIHHFQVEMTQMKEILRQVVETQGKLANTQERLSLLEQSKLHLETDQSRLSESNKQHISDIKSELSELKASSKITNDLCVSLNTRSIIYQWILSILVPAFLGLCTAVVIKLLMK